MAEQLAFARKASGLVRGLSMWDAFGVGFMNQGLTPSIVVLTSLGVGVYTGGNMIIAVALSIILAGIGMPIVWGVLGGSMPRSGGEYIYNSRILHPIIGIAESFGNAFVWIMWIYVLAPWVADPGFTMLASFTGWQSLADWATQPYATFILASIANVYIETGVFEQAILYLDRILSTEPDNEYALLEKSYACGCLGDITMEMNLLDQCLRINPENKYAISNKGALCMEKGDLNQAELLFQRALEVDADYPWAYYNLGCLHALRDNRELALAYLEKALGMDPTLAEDATYDNCLKGLAADLDFRRLLEEYRKV